MFASSRSTIVLSLLLIGGALLVVWSVIPGPDDVPASGEKSAADRSAAEGRTARPTPIGSPEGSGRVEVEPVAPTPRAEDSGSDDVVRLIFCEEGDLERRVEGVEFWLRSPRDAWSIRAKSNAVGVSDVECPEREDEVLLETTFLDTQRLDLGSANREFHVAVPRPVELRGFVLDPDGAPCPGARVLLTASGDRSLTVLLGVTDGHGRFEFDGVHVDAGIFAEHDLYARSVIVYAGAQQEGRVYQLQLANSVSYDGEVVDQDGDPVPGARVLLGPKVPRWLVNPTNGRHALEPPHPRVSTDGDGRFRFASVRPDFRESLTVRAPGFAVRTVEKNMPGTPIRIALEPCTAIVGTVQDPLGRPIPNVRVDWGDPQTHLFTRVWSDASGRFELDGVPDVPEIELKLVREGFSRQRAVVGLPERGAVRVVLRPE